jgi:hypothetical protein
MPLTAHMRTLILTQVGDTVDGIVDQLIDAIWDDYADYGVVHPRLQRLYTQRECIDLVLGKLREEVDAGLGMDLDEKSSQKVGNLQAQRAAVQAAIDQLEAQLRGARATTVGAMTTTEILSASEAAALAWSGWGPPDAGAPRYLGSPYFPLRGDQQG